MRGKITGVLLSLFIAILIIGNSNTCSASSEIPSKITNIEHDGMCPSKKIMNWQTTVIKNYSQYNKYYKKVMKANLFDSSDKKEKKNLLKSKFFKKYTKYKKSFFKKNALIVYTVTDRDSCSGACKVCFFKEEQEDNTVAVLTVENFTEHNRISTTNITTSNYIIEVKKKDIEDINDFQCRFITTYTDDVQNTEAPVLK